MEECISVEVIDDEAKLLLQKQAQQESGSKDELECLQILQLGVTSKGVSALVTFQRKGTADTVSLLMWLQNGWVQTVD